MTTPDQPDEGQDPATSAGGNHSAPRPVPPLTPEVPATPEGDAPVSDPDATSVVAPVEPVEPAAEPAATDTDDGEKPAVAAERDAPTRISAFPAITRTTKDPSAVDGDASSSDRTTAPPVTPPSRSTEPTTTTPVVAPGPERTSVVADSSATRPVPTTPASTAPDADATRAVPLADPEQLAGSTQGQLRAGSREPLPEDEWADEPTKRTGAHIWGVLGILVAAPIAWFLLTDGALRTFHGLPPEPLNPAGPLSLAGGLLALIVIGLVTRLTSLGAWIWGGIIALAGLANLIFPRAVDDWLTSSKDAFLTLHEGFGTNVHDYLTVTGRSGLLLMFGIVLLLLAFVSHGSRRSGRYEGRLKAVREARGL